LDAQRVKNIVDLVASDEFGQVFITDTNRNHTDQLMAQVDSEVKIFNVTGGSVVLT
jgi:DNA replication and repair protein RecF